MIKKYINGEKNMGEEIDQCKKLCVKNHGSTQYLGEEEKFMGEKKK